MNYVASASSAEEVCEAIIASGGQATAFQADISDPAAVSQLITSVVEKYGTLDVLVNNAGITKDTLMVRMKPEQWQAVIDTNLSAVFYAVQASQCAESLACRTKFPWSFGRLSYPLAQHLCLPVDSIASSPPMEG